MDLDPALEPIAFLLGTWRGRGRGEYPTISPFEYAEEIEFAHAGRPWMSYRQSTVNLATGMPSHGESGFLRPQPGGRLEVVIAQLTGFAEILEGSVRETAIDLRSTTLVPTPTAKPVEAEHRRILVEGDTLTYEMAMAFGGRGLTHHLRARLTRV